MNGKVVPAPTRLAVSQAELPYSTCQLPASYGPCKSSSRCLVADHGSGGCCHRLPDLTQRAWELTSMRAPYIRLAFCAGEVKAIAPQLLALSAQAASRNWACLGGLEP